MTLSNIVRASKYRHVFGQGSKKENCYDGVQVSLNGNDWHLVNGNTRFLSVHWDSSGGGSFLVLPIEKTGRVAPNPPLFNGHSGPVLDTDWNPFNDHVVASAGDDGRILLWKVPENGPTGNNCSYASELTGHERRIIDLEWHPAGENILSSASHDMTVRIWDISKGVSKFTLTGHCDVVLDQGWSLAGDKLATTSKDKALRIFDPRASEKAILERPNVHLGVKGVRFTWLGDTGRLVTTGFGRMSEREVALWDERNLENPLTMLNIDSASGPLSPFYDIDCQVLYLAGRGDGNIRYYEMLNEAPFFYPLSEFKTADPQRGLAMLPKRCVNVAENEITRFIKIYGSLPILEPISFRVPRRDQTHFQSDIYPDALVGEPSMTSEEFLSGLTKPPKRASMQTSFVPQQKEFVPPTMKGDQSREPETEEELREAWRLLIKENSNLKNELNQRQVRIRQLESLIQSQSGENFSKSAGSIL